MVRIVITIMTILTKCLSINFKKKKRRLKILKEFWKLESKLMGNSLVTKMRQDYEIIHTMSNASHILAFCTKSKLKNSLQGFKKMKELGMSFNYTSRKVMNNFCLSSNKILNMSIKWEKTIETHDILRL
jgi:hypothetical protein